MVVTNVPYLARGKQSDNLKDFISSYHADAKQDLATAFLDRCLDFCAPNGTIGIVTPQNWHFLTSYAQFRKRLLTRYLWNIIARLGPAAFEDMNWWAATTQLSIISQKSPNAYSAFIDVNASETRITSEKPFLLKRQPLTLVNQANQMQNPDYRISPDVDKHGKYLAAYSDSLQGMATGDYSRFGAFFWEIGEISSKWEFQQSTVLEQCTYGGREHIVLWENGTGDLSKSPKARIQGLGALGKVGVAVSQMNRLYATLYTGELFDNNTAVIVPRDPAHLPAIWSFCSSKDFFKEVRKIDRSTAVTNATLVKVPFDLKYWENFISEKYPNGLPKPYSNDPTQWIYHGHPAKVAEASSLCNQRQDAAATLQVAVARLLGYRWPAELDTGMELADEQREWASKCDGVLKYVDEDGIVCIPSVRGEETADGRLRAFLSVALGSDWSPSAEQELIRGTGANASSLDVWLRDHFFEQHCKLFHHRPFIWHIWDGRRRDGFHALVNYHKLAEGNGKGRQLLESLTYSYLGDWIARQKEGVRGRGEGGAEDRLTAALELQKRLIAIIEGGPPLDIFVRWKPIEEQPIGWEPDINDGVRLNIRPFMAQDIPGGRKGAGILRWKPNINWNKDRGKDVASAPWFALFKGDRVNDHHLSLEEKRRARAEANRREGETENG